MRADEWRSLKASSGESRACLPGQGTTRVCDVRSVDSPHSGIRALYRPTYAVEMHMGLSALGVPGWAHGHTESPYMPSYQLLALERGSRGRSVQTTQVTTSTLFQAQGIGAPHLDLHLQIT